MTQIVVSLTEETTERTIDRMVDLAPLADLFEIRGDRLLDLDLLTLLRAKTKPLVFTCRSPKEGGAFAGGEADRHRVLLEAVKRGFDWVDVEYRSEFIDVMVEKTGSGLIVSWHDLDGMPEDLAGLYVRMCERGADVVKIAVTPKGFADVARLLELAQDVAQNGSRPLIAIALGPLGLLTRILAGRYGAPFAYAASAPGQEAAPGQIDVATLVDLYRVREITAQTKVYGVLGSEVTRSVSPRLHNRAFQALGLAAVYVPLQAEALLPFMEALPKLGLSGFSVTRPFKTAILPHLQEIEESAARSGSVNTVVVDQGNLRGSSTDGQGVSAPLRRLVDPKGKAATIVGAGGAARAAALALRDRGAHVTVLARDPRQARDLAAAIGCGWGPLPDGLASDYDILVNATPLGSHAFPDATPVDAPRLRRGAVVFDMVYDPLETRLLREARAAGCRVIGGIEMLVAQALAQFEAWTGLEAPVAVMRAAAGLEAQRGRA